MDMIVPSVNFCSISSLFIYLWSIVACGGGVLLCVESQGLPEFESAWADCCPQPSSSALKSLSDDCKHYSVSLKIAHHCRESKAIEKDMFTSELYFSAKSQTNAVPASNMTILATNLSPSTVLTI